MRLVAGRVEKAECGYCQYERTLKQDGTFRKHGCYVGYSHIDCPGSGKTPEQAANGWGKAKP